ncbi:MAG: prepilin-type N-terminal cleavage/methylation domain-containing protein [Acidobacteriota bacterium]
MQKNRALTASPRCFTSRCNPFGARSRHSRAGFSVIELLVVIGVLSIISVLAIPAFLNQLGRLRLESAASDIANVMNQTRLRAIRDNTEYSIEVVGTSLFGVGVIDVIELELTDDGAELYTAISPADCQDKYDGSGESWGGTKITWDSTGVATDAGGGGTEGTGAVCVFDGEENVLQVVLPFSAGQPKIRKFLKAADAPGGTAGFYERTSAASSSSIWAWY